MTLSTPVVDGNRIVPPPPLTYLVAEKFIAWFWQFIIGPLAPMILLAGVTYGQQTSQTDWHLSLLWSSESAFFVVMVPLLIASRADRALSELPTLTWWLPKVKPLCVMLALCGMWCLKAYYSNRTPPDLATNSEVISTLWIIGILSVVSVLASISIAFLEFAQIHLPAWKRAQTLTSNAAPLIAPQPVQSAHTGHGANV